MKIIDKSPLQKENGEIDLLGRLQGTLRYGFSWYPEQQAQKAVIAQFQRLIEKGFVLIRNLTLPGSEIVVPIILVGPQGVNVIYVTTVRGFYEARGDEWNTVSNGRAQLAKVNLLSRVKLMARAVQLYLRQQNLELPTPIEPVLIGADPGFHVEATRPAVRVIMSDAIKQFGASLLQARPALRSQQVYELADRIVTPRPPQGAAALAEPGGPARAKAIFDAAEEVEGQSFDPSDLSFSFEEGPGGAAIPSNLRESSPAQPLPRAPKKGRALGMSTRQLVFLLVLTVVECCVLAAGAYFIFNQ